MDVVAAWEALESPWRRTFELAWEAHGAGTIPVGALIVDADGSPVAEGRNRIYEQTAPARQVAWTRLAHAEVNALSQLGPERRWEDHTLYTSLEPCILCVGAALLSTLGRIRFASLDFVGGAFTTRGTTLERMHSPPLERDGPLSSPLALLSEALLAAFFIRHAPDARPFATFLSARPAVAALGSELDARGSYDAARSGEPLGNFLRRVTDLWEAPEVPA